MIISYKHDFIFMKTRKTGGTSVQIALSMYCGDDDIITGAIHRIDGTIEENYGTGQNTDKFGSDHPHPKMEEVKKFVGDETWDSMFKFGFVRNPYDLVVSRYHWDIKGKGKQEVSIKGFRDWLKNEYFGPKELWKNDLQFLYLDDPDIKIYKYEHISSEFGDICCQLRLPNLPLGEYKSGYRDKTIPLEKWYDDYSASMVSLMFRADFDRFGYSEVLRPQFVVAEKVAKDEGERKCVISSFWDDNINGPCVIRVPDWIENPLGRYYMYYAHHQGKSIRFTYADSPLGPWKFMAGYQPLHYENTPCDKHIASPEVIVDHENQRFDMYYHGDLNHHQYTFHAESENGVNFKSTGDTRLVDFYARYFKIGDTEYMLAKDGNTSGRIWKNDPTGTELGPLGSTWKPIYSIIDSMRHGAVLVEENEPIVHIFYSRIGDFPEHIRVATVDFEHSEVLRDRQLLIPKEDWEGAKKEIFPSTPGRAWKAENQLRDPYIFVDTDGQIYLYYAAAGESCIGIVKLEKTF